VLRTVLFDLDGVLVHTFGVWLELTRSAVRELGDGHDVTREEFLQTWGQPVSADVVRWYPQRSAAEVDAYYAEHFMEHVSELEVNADAGPLVEWLAERGVALAVVTNTPGPLAKRILERASIDIAVVVGGSDVAFGKPAPDMLLRALEILGAPAASAVMVGDTENDRRAAKAASVRFVGLGLDCDQRLERLRDLRELFPSPGLPKSGDG
jgi:AHBA synthesis associated protein